MNVNDQTSTEVIGSATMAVTFLLSAVNLAMAAGAVDINKTILARVIINEVSMLATIIIWNMNNKQLWDHTRELMRKVWKCGN